MGAQSPPVASRQKDRQCDRRMSQTLHTWRNDPLHCILISKTRRGLQSFFVRKHMVCLTAEEAYHPGPQAADLLVRVTCEYEAPVVIHS